MLVFGAAPIFIFCDVSEQLSVVILRKYYVRED